MSALGAQLAPENWQGHLTFLVSEGRLKISIANRPTLGPAAATTGMLVCICMNVRVNTCVYI